MTTRAVATAGPRSRRLEDVRQPADSGADLGFRPGGVAEERRPARGGGLVWKGATE